jgi:hypothetical protein
MVVCSRWLIPLATVAICAVSAIAALGHTNHGGPLTGNWSGYIAGQPGSDAKRQHIVIVVNAKQSGGSWKLTDSCHGPLTLDSISNGYHHYRRKLAKGASCAGGDIDCLKRVGANVYDSVTAHRGGEYDQTGTLYPARHN